MGKKSEKVSVKEMDLESIDTKQDLVTKEHVFAVNEIPKNISKNKKSKKDNKSEFIVERYETIKEFGLNSQQIQERTEHNLINYEVSIKSKSVGKIILSNTLTLFNFINIFLAILLATQNSYKNMLFMGVVIINVLIATIQEIRAKKTIDKLSLLSKDKIRTIRDGNEVEVGIYDLLLDDIIILESGAQVPSDCIVIDGSCDCNESLLTGESDAIHKLSGDELLSGSFLVSGKVYARVIRINEGNFVSGILKGAKHIKETKSDIMTSLNKIIKFVTIIIIPVGLGLFFSQKFRTGVDMKSAIEKTVASLVGMIPEGLILLASTVFAVSVLRLAKHKVLIQDLYATETLARVDTLCLDKTGTITEGIMEVSSFVNLSDRSDDEIKEIISALTHALEDNNATMVAVRNYFGGIDINWIAKHICPFSSQKKWSGVSFEEKGTFVMGAGEFVLKSINKTLQKKIDELSEENRVLVIAESANNFKSKDELPNMIKPIALIAIRDKIREEAPATLEYFRDQGVNIKIISGDNVITVSNIAKRAGVLNYDKYIDLSTIHSDEELFRAAEEYTVFGRVTPNQKKTLITALKAQGHTVAMTGDGVNDVLALKEADCSVVMASGSEAAKNVAQLVLLDSNFASMPKVVAEGRRAINNLQLSGSLFLVKTIYSMLLTVFVMALGLAYPLVSIQLTLISSLAVGIPAFFLALEPNKERLQGRFIKNVLKRAFPGGLAVFIVIAAIYFMYYQYKKYYFDPSSGQYIINVFGGALPIDYADLARLGRLLGTNAILCVSLIHFMVLYDAAFNKFSWKKLTIYITMVATYCILVVFGRNFPVFNKGRANVFEIYFIPSMEIIYILIVSGAVACSVYILLRELITKSIFKPVKSQRDEYYRLLEKSRRIEAKIEAYNKKHNKIENQ